MNQLLLFSLLVFLSRLCGGLLSLPVMRLQLQILTPEETCFSGHISKVRLPGSMGSFEILPNHAPLISILVSGYIVYTIGQEKKKQRIEEGIVEVNANQVRVFLG